MPAYATGVVGTRGVRLAEEQIYRISGGKVSGGVGGTGKKASEVGVSAFGEMSLRDAKRYNQFWDDVVSGKSVNQRMGLDDMNLKTVGKQPYKFSQYDPDPAKKVWGSGKNSHLTEWNQIIGKLKKDGVEVVMKENGTMGYSPKTDFRAPQLNIDNNASFSALMHEQQHYLDDLADGFRGMETLFDEQFRIRTEFNAYMREIKLAEEAGNKELARKLYENFLRERNNILGK
ncbi:hypothetical protein H1Z61_17605 [Bacillus aquiflavi]|uniref:Uncharacterized protein n=2 Tax=Bacillus aquiflavi TaxID=2672567 RepID=A0A6B3VYR6_9BACI|nr:hypothetical protein [Bacillus aquiflavi]NEY83219.1 hypothetical protein [Bacillus aquiflavi]